MDRLKGLLKQLRALFRRRSVEAELAEELAFHLEMEIAENERRGMSAKEARRMAMVSFGGADRFAERVREVRWTRWLEDAAADVRYATRMLSRHSAFTIAIVLTLGLGIGGTTAIFTVVDALFLRAPEGVADAATLRKIYIARDEGGVQTGSDGGPGSWVDYTNMREQVRSFASIGASVGAQLVDLGRGAEASQLRAQAVSSGYLDVLGVQPALGRLIGEEADAPPGSAPVAVISHGLWQTHFGGADVLGETLLLNGETVEITGVTQKGFGGLDVEPVDVWLPASMAGPLGMMLAAQNYDWRTSTGMVAIDYVARLAPGVDDATAAAEATVVVRHAAESDASLDPTPEVITGGLMQADVVGGSSAADLSLWLAFVASLVLIIACANVANLLLARGMTRRRELAVRLSMGASRWRVARQHLTESLVLALLGGAAGILLATWGMRLMQQFPLPPSAGRLDARLLLFALGLSVFTGLLFGTLPAIRSTQIDLVTGLKDTRISGGGSTRSATRRTLVALQVSLSLALLIGAGLFVRSLRQVNSIDMGAEIERLLMVNVDLARAGYAPDERELFYQRAMQRLESVPGVESTAMVHFEPGDGSGMSIPWAVPGREAPAWLDEGPYVNLAGAGYFETAGTRILRGRGVESIDSHGEPVAVVNERMALVLDDAGEVVGRCVPFGSQVTDGGCTRIVGVVETQRRRYLQDDSRVPMVFLARAQTPNRISWGGPTLLVRTSGRPHAHVAVVRAALQGLSSDLPFVRVRPVTENIRNQVLPFQLGATLFSLFGILALTLAAVGLYGVLGYFVTERTPEIGIRRSLGAPARSVVRLVVLQGMLPVTAGVLVGLAGAYAGTRFLASLLFGIDARDPASFVGAAAFMIAVAAIATLLPAWRAARVSPMVALRQD